MMRTLVVIPAVVLLCACASTNGVDRNFGQAVAQQLREQIANPEAAAAAGDAPVVGMDPVAAQNALTAMREAAGTGTAGSGATAGAAAQTEGDSQQ